MKQKTFLFITLVLLFVACHPTADEFGNECSTEAPISGVFTILPNDMAYTSPNELYGYYVDDPTNVIHYNVARLLAETELLAGANFVLNADHFADQWCLTTYPKVVLNYDNTPKYYEFGYIRNGQLIATITTYAKKEIAGVIAYIFEIPLTYDCPDLDYYVGDYPNRYYGINGFCYLKNCDELLDDITENNVSTSEEAREWMLQQMSTEDKDSIQQDMNEQGESLDRDIQERDEYWSQIDDFVENYLSELLNEEEYNGISTTISLNDIVSGSVQSGTEFDYVSQLADMLDYTIGYYNTGVLAEYSDIRLQATHWSGFCGPAVCAWVYRGKFDSYNGYYLPIYGDGQNYMNNYYFLENLSDGYAIYFFYNSLLKRSLSTALGEYIRISDETDNGLSACFYNESIPFYGGGWNFPLYHGGLNRGFRAATNGLYHVKFTCKPYDWITLNNQPVIIVMYAPCPHYVVAFGYGVTKKNNGNVKDKYFRITDNGTIIGNNNNHPCWYKKNFWNLHYGLTR